MPVPTVPNASDRVTTTATNRPTTKARTGNFEPLRFGGGNRFDLECHFAGQPNAHRIHGDVDGEGAHRGPGDLRYGKSEHRPHRQSATNGTDHGGARRQINDRHHEGGQRDHGGQAVYGAGGDKGRLCLERQHDVGRSGGGGKGADQSRPKGAGAFGRSRRCDNNRRSDRHPDEQGAPEFFHSDGVCGHS